MLSYPLDWKAMSLIFRRLVRKYEGLENLPSENPYIFAINHMGMIDSPFIVSVLMKRLRHRIHFLAKHRIYELYGDFIARKIFRTIRVHRDNPSECLIEAQEWLRKGESVGIFPEGERNPGPVLRRGKTGAARLALAARKPIIPIGYSGPVPLTAREDDLRNDIKALFTQRQPVVVRIGKPLFLDRYYGRQVTYELLREITDKLMVEIGKLCGKKYLG